MFVPRLFLTLLIALLPIISQAQSYVSVEVLRVSDGDTITVKAADDTFKIRVAGIDAPESKQVFGIESRNALRTLLKNRAVTVSCFKIDKYQRRICRIRTDADKDVALAMISLG
jgi:endonuclease YncB( thermonuclease family)